MSFQKVSAKVPPREEVQLSKPVDGTPAAFEDLVKIVKDAYTYGTTMEEAEKHAARFLEAQFTVAAELATLDIDARMKKNGMKAARAQSYLDACAQADKKPSDTFLEQHVQLDKTVCASVDMYERADARRENLMLYMGIFKDGHIYFRALAKGTYNG